MSKKILSVDLDGTLFSDDKSVSAGNLAAIEKMLDAGHFLAVNTGRPIHVMEKLLAPYKDFRRDSVYVLGYQGSVCANASTGEILFSKVLDHEAACQLIKSAFLENLTPIIFDQKSIYALAENENTAYYSNKARTPIIIVDSVDALSNIDICKIMIVDANGSEALAAFKEANDAVTDTYFNSMFSDITFLEYVNKDVSKGNGLAFLADKLQIAMEDTVAVGDERNDISMIKAAGIGAAMINGHGKAREIADYITENDNNNDAIAEIIYKFILKGVDA